MCYERRVVSNCIQWRCTDDWHENVLETGCSDCYTEFDSLFLIRHHVKSLCSVGLAITERITLLCVHHHHSIEVVPCICVIVYST
jgi:hypothetical protein